ncbi:TRAP transporter small permease subunit [Pelagicoccus sp. SDUM812003]|nr:TRAP transporter small permease subunit [Pelagicoccus sp. SDUM812003]MDQ8205162.1 TRAP transporter small permease subunit [Pelagicoccus sp. SDUM812003]
MKNYVRWVDRINKWLGLAVMYLVFVMMGILIFAAISRTAFDKPYLWVMEMAQFTMAAYYLLGGGFSLQEGAHVRMDVFYEKWSPRTKAKVDSVTALALISYLVILLWGGYSSSLYALEYGQKNYTAWAPPLAPIKIIMTIGILLMLLQAISIFIKDLYFLFSGRRIGGEA